MSLQHNNTELPAPEKEETLPHSEYGVVVTCSGEGIKELFSDMGENIVIVDGGQSMNPSAEDFIAAYKKVNADTVFVFPNNSNIILTARQAASMYKDCDVRVIESKTVGDGYAAISMLDTSSNDADAIETELTSAMGGVVTAEISRSVRDTQETRAGEYIGFVGKDILSSDPSRFKAVCETVEKLDFASFDICLLIMGKEANEAEAAEIESYITTKYKGKEVYIINGKQEIYDYILILE